MPAHQSLLSKRSYNNPGCQETRVLFDGSYSAAHLPVGRSCAWKASFSPAYCHVTHFPSQSLSVLRSSNGLRCVIASPFDLRNLPVCYRNFCFMFIDPNQSWLANWKRWSLKSGKLFFFFYPLKSLLCLGKQRSSTVIQSVVEKCDC